MMERSAEIYQDLDRILVTSDEIHEKVRELGRKIGEDYKGKSPVMICILKGACIFFSDLIREIPLPLTTDFMAISSYGSATKTSGVVRILKDLDKDILGKDVIIVEDIVDTGITLNYLMKILIQSELFLSGEIRPLKLTDIFRVHFILNPVAIAENDLRLQHPAHFKEFADAVHGNTVYFNSLFGLNGYKMLLLQAADSVSHRRA